MQGAQTIDLNTLKPNKQEKMGANFVAQSLIFDDTGLSFYANKNIRK